MQSNRTTETQTEDVMAAEGYVALVKRLHPEWGETPTEDNTHHLADVAAVMAEWAWEAEGWWEKVNTLMGAIQEALPRDAKRPVMVTPTQAQAIDAGRPIVANSGGGELRIKGRDGRLRDSDTIAPGHESARRDTK